MKNFFKFLPIIIVIITVFFLVEKIISDNKSKKAPVANDIDSPMLGKLIPENVTLGLSRDDLIGKKSIINVFASWCVACQYEHPLFMNLKDSSDVMIIGVSWRDKKDDTKEWLERHGNPYDKVLYDDLGKYGISLGIRGVPETFLLDENAKVLKHYRGNIDKEFIDSVIGVEISE